MYHFAVVRVYCNEKLYACLLKKIRSNEKNNNNKKKKSDLVMSPSGHETILMVYL